MTSRHTSHRPSSPDHWRAQPLQESADKGPSPRQPAIRGRAPPTSNSRNPSRGGGGPRRRGTSQPAPIDSTPLPRSKKFGSPGPKPVDSPSPNPETKFRQMSLLSRADSTAFQQRGLQDLDLQEEYYALIRGKVEQYLTTYGPTTCPVIYNPNTPQVSRQRSQLDDIVASFRKLREGITAARRVDTLAMEAYELSVEMSILANNPGELVKSFRHLFEGIYPHIHPNPVRKMEMVSYFSLFSVSQSTHSRRELGQSGPGGAGFDWPHIQRVLGDHYLDIRRLRLESAQPSSHLEFTFKYLRLLLYFERFWSTDWLGHVNPYQRVLIQDSLEFHRTRTLGLLSRAYYAMSSNDVKSILDVSDDDALAQLIHKTNPHIQWDRPSAPGHFGESTPSNPSTIWFKRRPSTKASVT
ncbi:hypothetical protein H4R33_000236 [Dimargaris cristalligena]|nr:hypothetical protein H4R33_000236 [Dimargaris cristalligena]